ncbi:MAG: response regulator transcription factor [Acidobacteriota bacterium]|nr:response regulator transcription factor [Acidobacteriota bacterium]
MILAAVDDLMFASKIQAAAGGVGAALTFARTPADILEKVASLTPALVIFDLNSSRLQPIETIARLKAEPAHAGIRAIGFVSHVDTDTIRRARAAGIDEVMARSAFSKNLAEILKGTRRGDGDHLGD